MTPGDRDLGDAVVRRRQTFDMSQEELAIKAGVARDTIQALELGRRSSFQPKTLRKIDVALKWVKGMGLEEIKQGREPQDDAGAMASDDPVVAAVVELFTASIARLGELADQRGRAAGDMTVGARWMTDVLELRERAVAMASHVAEENRQHYA